MKKKLVLFTLLLGLLLPVVSGFSVAALRTEPEWHPLDRENVEKAYQAYRPGMLEIESAELKVKSGELAIQAWEDAVAYLEGAEMTVEEALKAYNETLAAVKTAEDAVKAAKKDVKTAEKNLKVAKNFDESSIAKAKAAADEAYAEYLKALEGNETANKELTEAETAVENQKTKVRKAVETLRNAQAKYDGLSTALRTAVKDGTVSSADLQKYYDGKIELEQINPLYLKKGDEKTEANVYTVDEFKAIEEAVEAVTTGSEVRVKVRDEIDTLYAVVTDLTLGNEFLQGKDWSMGALDTFMSDIETDTRYSDDSLYGKLIAAQEKVAEGGANATDKVVNEAHEKWLEAQEAWEALAPLEGNPEAQAELLKQRAAEHKAAVDALADAELAQEAANATKEKALKALEGARAAASGSVDESAKTKVQKAADAAAKEFAERDTTLAWTLDYAKELLEARKAHVEALNEKWAEQREAYELAVWTANNRPLDVTGVKAVSNSDATVTVSWNAVEADYLNVYTLGTKENPTELTLLVSLPGDATSYVDNRAVEGEKNIYVVIARDIVEGESIPGYQAAGEFGIAKAEKSLRPDEVTGLNAVMDNDGYVTLSWNASNGADFYRVIRLDSETGKPVEVIAETKSTSFQDEDAVGVNELAPKTKIFNFYTVEAVHVTQESGEAPLEHVSASVNPYYVYAQANLKLRVDGPPSPIQNLSAKTNPDGTITLSWSNDPKAFYYVVTYIGEREDLRNGVAVNEFSTVKGNSLTLDNVEEGYHFYRVYGVNKVDGQFRIGEPADPNYVFTYSAGTEA